MAVDEKVFADWASENRQRICQTVVDLVGFATVTPDEPLAYPYLQQYLGELGMDVRVEPFPEGIESHPNYSDSPMIPPGLRRSNLRCRLDAPGAARRVAFNSHLDVVPAGPTWPQAFQGSVRDGKIFGRGACDTKQNLVMLAEAIRFMRAAGIPLKRSVLLDVVSEEEIGGNGTLACILNGTEADEVIVLEGTEHQVFCGHRGCLTFSVRVTGKPVHMGAYLTGVSAIEKAIKVIDRLKDQVERPFLAEAASDPYFEIWQGLTPVLIGMISGGQWPGTVPAECRITGNVGFLPRYSLQDVKDRLVAAIETIDDEWIPSHYDISYPALKNEAYLTERTAPVVVDLLSAAQACGSDQRQAYGWKVSCDARLYGRLTKMPTVIFGCGMLSDKHCDNEKIAIADLELGIRILAGYLAG